MNGNDIAAPPFRPQARDIAVAFGLLTRIPLPGAVFPASGERPAAYTAWAYPLVGACVGAVSAAAGWVALMVGLPVGIAALFAILGGILMTGAMHEDGLADCADGFWGAWTVERRLEIMKDSQIGTYGVLALLISMSMRWAAASALLAGGIWLGPLIVAGVVSRACMVGVMYALPNARTGGLSRQTGRPAKATVLIAFGIGITTLFLCFSASPFAALGVSAAVTLATGLIARVKIGGQTGDVLGATQQCVEIAVLLTCLATLT